MKTLVSVILATGGLIAGASAANFAVTQINGDGSNPGNVTSISTSAGTVSNLVGGTVTAFSGANNSNFLTPDGASLPSGSARLEMLGDTSLLTGIINPATGNTAVTYTFNSPVVNLPGPDIFFFEIASSVSALDSAVLLINGTSGTITGGTGGDYGTTGWGGAKDLWARNNGTPATSAQLLDAYTKSGDINDQPAHGVGIDLSDYGVAANATVSSIQFGSSGNTVDPVMIVGVIPEPAITLLGALGVLLLLRRRKN